MATCHSILKHSPGFFPFRFSFRRKNDQSNNGRRAFDGENHNLQEYTYKKITPCDVCSQVLRGKKSPTTTHWPFNRSSSQSFQIQFVIVSLTKRFSNFIPRYFIPRHLYLLNVHCVLCAGCKEQTSSNTTMTNFPLERRPTDNV